MLVVQFAGQRVVPLGFLFQRVDAPQIVQKNLADQFRPCLASIEIDLFAAVVRSQPNKVVASRGHSTVQS
jgi:hypothetical protein